MRVSLVTGTRPQIIKSAPVIDALIEAQIEYEFIHTGQHYDYELAKVFIDQFNLKPPVDLAVGPGDYCYQVFTIMKRLSSRISKARPDYLVVPGDTTSALAAALVGFKLDLPVCHLESGLRRYDHTFQEEVNRRLIDHGSSGLFAPTEMAVQNLNREEVLGRIYNIGDTMYDLLKQRLPRYTDTAFKERIKTSVGISSNEFALLTVHRRENVDSKSNLATIISAINTLDMDIVFPIHPHTQQRIQDFSLHLDRSHVFSIEPQGYDEFMSLVAGSDLVISDSGGVQKECYIMNVPLVSIQTRTEWVETYDAGANLLTPVDHDSIIAACEKMYGQNLNNDPSVYGDGKAAQKIPPILESGEIVIPTDRDFESYAAHFLSP